MAENLTKQFINIIDTKNVLLLTDQLMFYSLVDIQFRNIELLVNFIKSHPTILIKTIGSHYIFDYFYEKVVTCAGTHVSDASDWEDALSLAINLLDSESIQGAENIKDNKKYILKLQSTNKSYLPIFKLMLDNAFELGDLEFLVYSIIARGELYKLKMLSDNYVIEDYEAVLDVALRYGRHNILEYFISEHNIDVKFYGKVMDFENYNDNFRYLYYRNHMSHEPIDADMPIVTCSKQDYTKAINIIMEQYDYPITIETLDIWCDMIRGKVYTWDAINANEVLTLLKSFVESTVPLEHDFKEYNNIIFGHELSDRACIIQQYLTLQNKYEILQERYNILYGKTKKLNY